MYLIFQDRSPAILFRIMSLKTGCPGLGQRIPFPVYEQVGIVQKTGFIIGEPNPLDIVGNFYRILVIKPVHPPLPPGQRALRRSGTRGRPTLQFSCLHLLYYCLRCLIPKIVLSLSKQLHLSNARLSLAIPVIIIRSCRRALRTASKHKLFLTYCHGRPSD
jgi:hypothetical protein